MAAGGGGYTSEHDAADRTAFAVLLVLVGLVGAGLALAHRQHLSHSSRPGDACPVTANGGLIGFDARTGAVRWTNVVPEGTGLEIDDATDDVHALSAEARPQPDHWMVSERTIDATDGTVTACTTRTAKMTTAEFNDLIGFDDPLEPPLQLGDATIVHWGAGIRATDPSNTGIWGREASHPEVRLGDDLIVSSQQATRSSTTRIDLRTGEERWSTEQRYLGLGGDGSIVVTVDPEDPTAITGRDAETGDVRWEGELPWPDPSRDPRDAIDLGPLLAIPAGEEGRLIVLDSRTGRVRWTAEGGSPGRNWKHSQGGKVEHAALSADGDTIVASVTAWVPDDFVD
jgi:outer membrane protein assembly factor BamB